MSSSKFYAVKKGRVPGIYFTWDECKSMTNGFSGAVFKSFQTRKEAEMFISSGESFTPAVVTPAVVTAKKIQIVFESDSEEEEDEELSGTLFTDGGHNKSTGIEAWGSVVDVYGKDVMEQYKHLFTDMKTKVVELPVGIRRIVVSKFNDVSSQQNNGAELLALVIGLRIALDSNKVKLIKCDSKLLTEFWSKYLKPESRKKMDPLKAKYIDELIELRKKFEVINGVIEKIPGDDNLADLGFHIIRKK